MDFRRIDDGSQLGEIPGPGAKPGHPVNRFAAPPFKRYTDDLSVYCVLEEFGCVEFGSRRSISGICNSSNHVRDTFRAHGYQRLF